jgi:hypothetical protein
MFIIEKLPNGTRVVVGAWKSEGDSVCKKRGIIRRVEGKSLGGI